MGAHAVPSTPPPAHVASVASAPSAQAAPPLGPSQVYLTGAMLEINGRYFPLDVRVNGRDVPLSAGVACGTDVAKQTELLVNVATLKAQIVVKCDGEANGIVPIANEPPPVPPSASAPSGSVTPQR